MELNPKKTVREIAVEVPGATRVFERLNIDYCCGGAQSLGEACVNAGVNIEVVTRWLDAAEDSLPPNNGKNPHTKSLTDLMAMIVKKHHVYTRDALQTITLLLPKVGAAHATNHPELLDIETEFYTLCVDLSPHMMKEENILFPYIERLESSVITHAELPVAPFGTVQNPIAVMMKEHDAAGDILKTIRKLSSNFVVPDDACISYRTLYKTLAKLEADLYQHIHLENNILFPKAIALEENV